jgi:hypothetical protein
MQYPRKPLIEICNELLSVSQSQSYVTAVCHSASLSSCEALFGSQDQIFVTVRDLRGFVDVGHPHWREDESVV